MLVLSPHTDDGELGVGGTVARMIEQGINVTFIVLSKPVETPELNVELEKSLQTLGVKDYTVLDYPYMFFPKHRQEILQFLYDYVQENHIDIVFTPSTNDYHQDHETTTREAIRAFKTSSILGYIMPWNHIQTNETCFIPLETRHMKKKIAALNHYKSQKHRMYFNPKVIKALLYQSGLHINHPLVESFQVIKLVGWNLGG